MTKSKGKKTVKPEHPTEQPTEPVVTVTEVTPESPEETTEPKPLPEEEELDKFKILEPVVVPEDELDDIVKVQVIGKHISFLDPNSNDSKHYVKGDVFTTTKKRAYSLDQRFIRIV